MLKTIRQALRSVISGYCDGIGECFTNYLFNLYSALPAVTVQCSYVCTLFSCLREEIGVYFTACYLLLMTNTQHRTECVYKAVRNFKSNDPNDQHNTKRTVTNVPVP